MKLFNEMLDRMKFLQIEKLRFQHTEKVLGTSIVKTILFSGHALFDAFLFQHFFDSACADTAILDRNEESDLYCPVFLKTLSQAYLLPGSNSDDGLNCMRSLRHYINQ